MFVHPSEKVHANILHLLWKHKDLYSNIFFKGYDCLGFQDWFVDSRTTTAGSVNQSFELLSLIAAT